MIFSDLAVVDDHSNGALQERIVKLAFQSRGALEAYAYALLRNHSEAQDVVQDALIVVMKQYEDFREGSSMLAWTRAIVRRKVLQSLDRRKRRTRLRDRLLCDSVDAAFERLHNDSRAEELQIRQSVLADCLVRLHSQSKQLLELVYYKKQSYAQAAEHMAMKIEGVRKSLFRAKEQLRECVDQRVEAIK